MKILFNLRRMQAVGKKDSSGLSFLEYLHDIVYILGLILLIFTFCMRVVIVSGSSMFSTLVDGDYLLLINNPLCGEFEQGDIVVASMDRFRGGEAIVKRVIATEGQTVDIDFRNGIVYVDGAALEEEREQQQERERQQEREQQQEQRRERQQEQQPRERRRRSSRR